MKRPRRQKTITADFAEPRAFVTPEGVDLKLRVGSFTERALAFGIDAAIILGGLIVFSIFALIVAGWSGSKWVGEAMMVIWLLGVFGVRNFYFLMMELQPRAATFGKRAMGLRVVAADGGQLTADAVFARNAMREVEVFLPLAFLFARGDGVDGALITLGGIWSGVFALFPLFNRDRRRLGDLAAGALVVKSPKVLLQRDLVERTAPAAFAFSPGQLDAYGIKELHVLEQVLRGGDRRAIAQVAERIRAKIAWEGPADTADQTFLDAYYAALRGRLESRMLFGHRRKDKFDKA